METVEFLADIDSEKIYAAKLELAYNCAYQEVLKMLIDFPVGAVTLDEQERCTGWTGESERIGQTHKQLYQMKFVMRLQIRQMAERKRRLADAACGLTDRVLDEQSTQEELCSDPNAGDGGSDSSVGRD